MFQSHTSQYNVCIHSLRADSTFNLLYTCIVYCNVNIQHCCCIVALYDTVRMHYVLYHVWCNAKGLVSTQIYLQYNSELKFS
jgi:hypothetical protein